MTQSESRAPGLISWAAASVLTMTAVAHALSRARTGDGAAGPARESARRDSEARPVDQRRAHEHGRGRHATAPTRIPWRGWKDIAVRTYSEVQDDRLLALAAGVVFYSLLAMFPAIAAAVSLYAFFSDASTIASHLSLLAGVVPEAALDIVRGEVTRIAGRGDGRLTFGFLIGLAVALWSANAGMKAIIDALNLIYDEDEKRGFIRLNLVSLFMTLCAIAGMLIAASAVVAFPLVLAAIGLNVPAISLLRWPAMFALVILGLAALYRFGPSRSAPQWRWITVGSVVAAVSWLVGSSLFSWYLSNFANYNATYGALGAVIGLMVWMWLSTIVVLLGAELNSEVERQTAVDSTDGGEQPLGARGAVAADTVGEARAA